METSRGNAGSERADPDGCNVASINQDHCAWRRLTLIDHLTIALTLFTIAVVTFPRLPRGICYGDSGGLQLAATTLGITHPPGYAGYVSLAYLATLLPGVDPARAVSLACLGCGLAALLLCILIQVQLGVSAGIACALGLGLTVYSRVWSNLLAPEVYMPTLMFVAASAYGLIRYARCGMRRDLLLAAFVFGIALANRPPVAFTLPFFLVAWWLAAKRSEMSWRRSAKSLALATACAALPGLYSLGYLWVRDTPNTPYDYLEQFNAEAQILPQTQNGPRAKVERIVWLTTGRQFRDKMGDSLAGVRLKLRWLRNELLPDRLVPVRLMPYQLIAFVMGLTIVVLATCITYQRCRASAVLLAGMALGSVMFVCMYRMHGDAADILPLLFVIAVLTGVALSPVFPVDGIRWQRFSAMGLAAVMCLATVYDAQYRHKTGARLDALPFLHELDMPTLPRDAVICSHWGTSTPLWYAQLILFDRRDIYVINAPESAWARMTSDLGDRPTFSTSQPGTASGFAAEPFRNIWRLTRTDS